MANYLWGQVHYKDQFAGIIREEPGNRTSFTYDQEYINSGSPAFAYNLPLQTNPIISTLGLLPFFDNLVAEGWLEQAQKKSLGKRIVSRFELLLAYGYDCAGAVYVVDPEPEKLSEKLLNHSDPKEMAVLTHRASLSGVQPKLAVLERDGKFFPTKAGELSTHIAKFSSPTHRDLIFNEYLSMLAFKTLLPKDHTAEVHIGEIESINLSENPENYALIIKRFDRENNQRKHFEEFNQLLDHNSQMKYEGAYQNMSQFILNSPLCAATDNYFLFLRIIAGILIGNTDMHFKNFAMQYNANNTLQLAPSYDQVAAVLYDYKTLALAIGDTQDLSINQLKAKHIVQLGKEFSLTKNIIKMAADQLNSRLEPAMDNISNATVGSEKLKNQLTQLMRKKWNQIYNSIGTLLSKRQ